MFLSPYLAAYFARWTTLRALCLSVWAGTSTPDAGEIADSIATAVLEEPTPVFASAEEDAAVLAIFARGESGLDRAPKPQSWDARAGVSCGVWQQRCRWLSPTILGQARVEIELLARGAVLCPASPAAPLSGGCHGAGRRLADARVARAMAVIR